MHRHAASKPKSFSKCGRELFALSAVVAVVGGCAEIPSVDKENLAAVAVDVIGGSADIFPGPEFSVPVGGDTLLFVDVSREQNTRIAGIWVDGGRQCCAEEEVVRSTWVSLVGVGGGVTVTVELAQIDTVLPILEIVSPMPTPPGEAATGISICSFGAFEYRLNKTMAKGYIKWWKNVNADDWEDRDSLQVVKIPGDITRYSHDIGAWSYSSPDGYLSEGLQKFDLAVSPIAGKRISRSQITANAVYTFEIQFTDSLGNESERVLRTVWANNVNGGCF
ncbi:MAG: hypothetical protein LBC59_00570 [Chitinispirillales bacterium]|jgi:hypothetical protein|nr:hypothetical protein [Chitinispirillales bacterium]